MTELDLVANLIAYPEQIQQSNVNAEWFENSLFAEIVNAIKKSNGELTRMVDLAIQINEERNWLDKIDADELQILKDSNSMQNGYFGMSIPFLHRDWLRAQIKRLTALYNDDPKEAYLQEIVDYKADLDAVLLSKDNGSLSSSEQYVKDLMDGKIVPHYIRSFSQYDQYFSGGFQADRLFIIGARPSVGKSAMAMNIAIQTIIRNMNMRVDFFSLESTKNQTFIRALSYMTNINSKLILNAHRLNDHQKSIVTEQASWIRSTDLRIYEAEYKQKMAIINKIRERATVENYLAIIDYAHLIDVPDSRKSEVERLSEVTRDLKLLANELHIPIILLSQINRAGAASAKPTMAELRGSGSLEQDADSIIVMYRANNDDPSDVRVDVVKNRDGQIGQLDFRFVPEYTRFE